MKCEHCGKNEVTFVYQSNINGEVTEKHLCGECAKELGYAKQFAQQRQRMVQDFFGRSLLDDFLMPAPSFMRRMNRMLEDPFDDFFADMPALSHAPVRKEEPKQEELVNAEEQDRFARMRRKNAMRQEMKRAVREENFERAAELRDQLRAMEGN